MTEFPPLCPQRHLHTNYRTKEMKRRGLHLETCACGRTVAVKPKPERN